MRHFFFHPLAFYPLAILIAAAIIALSLRPQSWPREPAPQAGLVEDGAIVLAGDALGAPAPDPRQVFYVDRNPLGGAEALRIAVLPNEPAPGPADSGVQILLAPDAAARLDGRPVRVEVSVRPLEITTAQRLYVALDGAGPRAWTMALLSPQDATLSFDLPAQAAPIALGLRVESDLDDYNYGIEIARIRLVPAG